MAVIPVISACKNPETISRIGDKERFDKEQIGVKGPFPVTNCQFTS